MTAIFTSVIFLHSSNFAVIQSVIYSVISKPLHLLTGISNLLQSVIRQLWFYRDVCDKLKKFNSELIRLAQDRKFRFRVTKVFNDQSKEIKGSDKWD